MTQLVNTAKARGNFVCLSTRKIPQVKSPVIGNQIREKARNATISRTIISAGLYHQSYGFGRMKTNGPTNGGLEIKQHVKNDQNANAVPAEALQNHRSPDRVRSLAS